MTIRILRASVSVPAGNDQSVNADVPTADLEGAVPVGGSVRPFMVSLIEAEGTTDLSVKQMTCKGTKNDEGAIQIVPDGAAVKLADLNPLLSSENGGIDAPRRSVAHGLRFAFKCDNANAGARTLELLIKVENAMPFVPGEGGLNQATNIADVGPQPNSVFNRLLELSQAGPNSTPFPGRSFAKLF